MRFPIILLLGTGLLSLGGCDWGPPDPLRCGTQSVTVGDTSFDLTQRCGQPKSVKQAEGRPFARPVFDPNKNRYVIQFEPRPYQVWTYDQGPDRPPARIRIENGLITRIDLEADDH